MQVKSGNSQGPAEGAASAIPRPATPPRLPPPLAPCRPGPRAAGGAPGPAGTGAGRPSPTPRGGRLVSRHGGPRAPRPRPARLPPPGTEPLANQVRCRGAPASLGAGRTVCGGRTCRLVASGQVVLWVRVEGLRWGWCEGLRMFQYVCSRGPDVAAIRRPGLAVLATTNVPRQVDPAFRLARGLAILRPCSSSRFSG